MFLKSIFYHKIDYTKSPPEVIIIEEKKTVPVQVTVKATVKDKTGKVLRQEQIPLMKSVIKTERRRKLSKNFNPKLKYIPRSARKEWNIVGLLGVVKVLKKSPVNPKWTKIELKLNNLIIDTMYISSNKILIPFNF